MTEYRASYKYHDGFELARQAAVDSVNRDLRDKLWGMVGEDWIIVRRTETRFTRGDGYGPRYTRVESGFETKMVDRVPVYVPDYRLVPVVEERVVEHVVERVVYKPDIRLITAVLLLALLVVFFAVT